MLSKVSVVEVFMHYFQNLSSASAPTNNILVTYGALQVLYCIVLYSGGSAPGARLSKNLRKKPKFCVSFS